MQIKQIYEKEKYMELLLEADPDERIIKKYLNNSEMFGIFEDDEIMAQIVITEVDTNICELKNIATIEKARKKGYARKLIEYVFERYKSQYDKMIVGTTENNIPFYVKCGFDKYYKTIKNFFADNYSKEIWDGNLKCTDMYYYYKDLENNSKFKYSILDITQNYRKKVNSILIEEWESTNIIVRGKIIDGTKLNGFIAMSEDNIVGLITYLIEANECEIVSLNSYIENCGIATNLIKKVKEIAVNNKCYKLKLVTTNDNIKAIEFYQRKGFIFSNLYKNSMEVSRKLKPQIPLLADNGLPIRDEIEFEQIL